jgi:outer membrane protein assembly factor BamB
VCGYDPTTGAERWFATGFSRETIAMPVAGNGLVYVASSMLGGVADEQPDPEPFWKAMLQFDSNRDGRIQRSEMTRDFTFPFRPELPVGHPGFGAPLPDDPGKRAERQERLFASIDKDKDGFWTREEFLANMSFKQGKPILMAIRPGGKGDIATTRVVWELNRNIPEVPSPVFYKNRLYMVRDGGLLSAVDASTGEALYTERLGATGQYSASPVVAGGQIVLISNQGIVTVAKTGDNFEVVHQWNLGELAYVTPAFDSKTMYVRTERHLSAFRSR